ASSTGTRLLSLSTIADAKISNPPWVNFQSAGWVSFQSAPTPNWPQGPENIALCSLHSSKGLEFDHVIMIGLDGSILDISAPQDEADDDEDEGSDEYELSARLRRLIAMGIGRARESVVVGFKTSDTPDIMSFIDNDLYTEVKV
uniref:3'-5' exonuclease n=1 Tax=Pseudomonas mohnii TaxID=395600 RepID=UPI0030DCB30C